MNETKFPQKICRDLCVQQLGSEMLVYDQVRHRAFCLNQTSSVVWKLSDGAHTPDQVAAAAMLELGEPVSGDLVRFALQELRDQGLMEESITVAPTVSRRDLVRKLGISAVTMLPVVAAIMVPKAAQAYTGCLNCEVENQDDSGVLPNGDDIFNSGSRLETRDRNDLGTPIGGDDPMNTGDPLMP